MNQGLFGFSGNGSTSNIHVTDSYIASGSIAKGVLVSLMPDGTVTTTDTGDSQDTIGYSSGGLDVVSCYDSVNKKIIVVFCGASPTPYTLYAVVGTVVGNSISFGTPVSVATMTGAASHAIVFDSANGKCIIFYSNAGVGNQGAAIVGTVSGTSISFGSAVNHPLSTSTDPIAIYDAALGKTILLVRNSSALYGSVVTLSGTTPVFNSATNIGSSVAASNTQAISYDTLNSKIIALWADGTTQTLLKSSVGTISGTTITWVNPNTTQHTAAANINTISAQFDESAGKTLVAITISSETKVNSATITLNANVLNLSAFTDILNFYSTRHSIIYSSFLKKCVLFFSKQGTTQNANGAVVVAIEGEAPVPFDFVTTASSQYSISYKPGLAIDDGTGNVVFSFHNSSTNVMSRVVNILKPHAVIGISNLAAESGGKLQVNTIGSLAKTSQALIPLSTYGVTGNGKLAVIPPNSTKYVKKIGVSRGVNSLLITG